MSESTIPFQGGGTALLERPAPEFDPEPGNGTGNRTKLLAVGGLSVALVLGLVAYFLVFAGGEDAADKPAPRPAAGAPAPAEDEAADRVKQPRITVKNYGRDPFKPLISETVTAVDPAAPAGGTSTGTAGSPQATRGSGSSTGTTTQPETATPQASTAHSFKVVDVAPDNSTITVKVDGDVYRNVRAGEVFAVYFKVVLISGQVNSFQYGEEKFNVIGNKRLTIA